MQFKKKIEVVGIALMLILFMYFAGFAVGEAIAYF